MTTATLRPDASSGTGTVTGAASVHAALADDLDTSYVAHASGVNLLLTFDTFALPAGAVTKQFRARVRAGGGSVSGGTPFQAIPPSGHPAFIDISDVTDPIRTFVGAYFPDSLAQSDIDGFEMLLIGTADVGQRFYEAYADIIYVTIPVTAVTAVTPDPYTASNVVPIAWTNTLDADGGVQTRYEVKVYTDAQYGAGGFDPDTSTPYWESGVVVSSSLTVNTGALATGDTYRAYVRVSQTVNGAAHWGDWAYDTFDVDVDTADIATITATPHDSLARIQIDVTRDGAGEAWEFIEIERSVDDGATWSPVRFATYVDCTGDADDFQVFDYEVANDQNVLYRARATYLLSGLPITGEWLETADPTAWSSSVAWLKSPLDSTLNTTFCMSQRDVYARARRRGRFDVLGVSAPIVISDVMSTHSGRLTIETYDTTDAAALRALLEDTTVVLVQFPAAMDIADFYAAILAVDEVFISANSDNLWRVWSAPYDSVTAPSDPTAGQ